MVQRIRISPAFCAMMCLLGWFNLEYTVLFLIAIVIHEASHCLAALLCGVKVEQVCFRICGAVIQASGMNYRQEILIASAGPAASLVSGCIFLHIKPALFAISVILAAMNLLPIYPMDGGRILRSVLMLQVQESVVSVVMRISAYIICGVLMVAACWVTAVCQAGIWPIFAVLMLLIRVGEASCGM